MGRNRGLFRKPSAVAQDTTSSIGNTPVPASSTFVHVTNLPIQRCDYGVPPVLAQPEGLLHAPSGKLAQMNTDRTAFMTSASHSHDDSSGDDDDDEYELFEESAATGDDYAKQQDKKK